MVEHAFNTNRIPNRIFHGRFLIIHILDRVIFMLKIPFFFI